MRFIAALALGFSLVTPAAAEAPADLRSARVARQIGKLLQTHPLVGIGEMHRSGDALALFERVIANPAVFCAIDDIVVEFGNSRLQSISDRYVFGGAVSSDEKRSMWRDTGQWLVWDSPVYENFFDFVRRANSRRICGGHRVRVLLGDPPIDWSKVHDASDYRVFADRTAAYVDVVEREVLAKKHRALLIIGGLHLTKRGPAEYQGAPMEAAVLDERHPGALFSLYPVSDATARKLGLPPAPSIVLAHDAPFAGTSFLSILPSHLSIKVSVNGEAVWKPASELHYPTIAQSVDGLFNVGAAGPDVAADPAIYRDRAYQAELRRRAVILKEVFGLEFLPDLEAELSRR